MAILTTCHSYHSVIYQTYILNLIGPEIIVLFLHNKISVKITSLTVKRFLSGFKKNIRYNA